jgi:threonine dehydratase
MNSEIILQTYSRIQPFINRTPVLTSSTLDAHFECSMYFKCENFQKTGAFKARGAMNAVLSTPKELHQKGFITHSSGNHGAALAFAASKVGAVATIIMPSNAPKPKIESVQRYGGTIVFCEPTLQSREETMAQIQVQTGATVIPPYNHQQVIEGQATCAYELHQQVPSLDVVLAPIGGGGLMSGTTIATSLFAPTTTIIGVEPFNASDAFESLQKGTIQPPKTTSTIADGLRTSLGDITFPLLQKHLQEIRLVKEESIIAAMKLIMETLKIVIEPSAAVSIGTLLEDASFVKDKKVGIIICGGNVDLTSLPF